MKQPWIRLGCTVTFAYLMFAIFLFVLIGFFIVLSFPGKHETWGTILAAYFLIFGTLFPVIGALFFSLTDYDVLMYDDCIKCKGFFNPIDYQTYPINDLKQILLVAFPVDVNSEVVFEFKSHSKVIHGKLAGFNHVNVFTDLRKKHPDLCTNVYLTQLSQIPYMIKYTVLTVVNLFRK
jgi:hypothetical protein